MYVNKFHYVYKMGTFFVKQTIKPTNFQNDLKMKWRSEVSKFLNSKLAKKLNL